MFGSGGKDGRDWEEKLWKMSKVRILPGWRRYGRTHKCRCFKDAAITVGKSRSVSSSDLRDLS